MKKLKNVALALLCFLVIGTLSPAHAQAPSLSQPSQSTSHSSSVDMLYQNVEPNVPKNLHTLTQNTIIEVLSSVTCVLSGHDPLNPKGACLGYNPQTGKIAYTTPGESQGVAQLMGGLLGSTMNIPVSSADYASYAFSHFGITKPAYAQQAGSTGFASMTALIGIWARFRDLAYLFFVLAFTLIGLAIMFRVKIDARTVMTIQNQIPKIVIALIMVTFSFAIAGFLIDMMYVAIYLILLTFSPITSVHVNSNASVFTVVNNAFNPSFAGSSHLPGGGILNLTGQISTNLSGVFTDMAGDFLNTTMAATFRLFFSPLQIISSIGCTAVSIFTNPINGLRDLVGGGIGSIPGLGGIGDFLGGGGSSCDFVGTFFHSIVYGIFAIIAFIVVLIAIIYTLFRVWVTLIKSFIYVLLDVLIGPLWIAAGVFPGSKLGFGTWVRHLAAHLSVFPMTFAVILLGKTIMDAVGSAKGPVFSPPLVGDAVGGNTFLAAIIGFGFILSIPSILERTKKVIGAIDFGLVDIKASFGVGRGLADKGTSGVTGAAFGSKYELGPQGQSTAVGGPKRFIKGMLGR